MFWALGAAYGKLPALPHPKDDNLTAWGWANLVAIHSCWWSHCSL